MVAKCTSKDELYQHARDANCGVSSAGAQSECMLV